MEDGGRAVEFWEAGQYDLIMMDVQMPVLDGMEATRQIRSREAGTGNHIPILAVTAHSMEGDQQKCLDAGMDDYVSKPVRQEALARAIERVIPDSLAPLEADDDQQPSVDCDEALQVVGGDRELLRDVVDAMVEELPQLMLQLQQALAENDQTASRRAAHTIKGSTRIFSRVPRSPTGRGSGTAGSRWPSGPDRRTGTPAATGPSPS